MRQKRLKQSKEEVEKLKSKKRISKKRDGYFKCLYKEFTNSLKDAKKVVLIVALYDLLFYVFLYLGSKLIAIMTNRQLEKIQPLLGMMTTMSANLAELEKNLTIMKGFQAFLIIAPIIFLLFVIIDWTIFKGLIWVAILRKRFSLKYFKNFLALNLLWFIPWTILLLLVVILVRQRASAYMVLLLFILLMHLSGVLCITFTKKDKIINAIKEAFCIGIGKIHLFLVPYLALIILFIVVSQVGWIFRPLPHTIQAILSLIVLVLYTAFARVFLSKIVLSITKDYS
jgi:hypothetical protein